MSCSAGCRCGMDRGCPAWRTSRTSPPDVHVVGCISAVFEYAVYDAGTGAMLGYAEGMNLIKVGSRINVTHNSRGVRLDDPLPVVIVELDETAWD